MSETLATSPEPVESLAVSSDGATASRIARNTAVLALGDAATKAAVFVLYAVIARSLGQSGFGDYTLAVSLAFFIRVSALGADVILSREVARDPDHVHGLFWHSVLLKLLVGIPVLIGITAFAVLTGESTGIVVCVALIGLSNLIDVVAFSIHAVLRGREQMGPPARALALESGLLVLLGSVLLLALDGTLAGLGVVYVVAAVCGLAAIAVAALRRGVKPRLRGSERGLRWLAGAAVPTGIANFFSLALGRLDAVILSLMTGSAATVGLYGGAYRVFEATLLVNWAFGLAIFPMLSTLQRGSRSLRNAFELACKVVSALTAPLFGVLLFFGGPLLALLLGPGFEDAGTAIAILGGATFLYGLFAVAALTVAGQDRQRSFPWIAGVALAVNVGLNLVLIPPLGINGAAIAMTVAQGLATALLLGQALRQTGGASLARMLSGPAVGFAGMAAVSPLLGDGVGSLVGALAAYVLCLGATERVLFPRDVSLIVSVARSFLPARRGAGPWRHARPSRIARMRAAMGDARRDLAGPAIVLGTGLLAGLLAVLGMGTQPLVPVAVLVVAGVVALAVYSPVTVVYLAVLAIPLETLSAKTGGFGLTPTELLMLAAAAGWLLRRLALGGGSLRSPMTLPLLALLVAHIPGLFLATDRFAVVKELVMWSAGFVAFLALLSDDRPRTTETLARVIAASGALVACLAVAKSAGTQQVVIDFGGSVTDRATGSFQSPVLLAIFVAMTLPLQLAFALRGRTLGARLAGRVGTIAVIAAMALALTRSAFVGLSIAVIWLAVAWRPARRFGLAVFLILGILLLTNFNPAPSVINTEVIVKRISSISSPQTRSVQLRLELWRASPRILEDNLPFGIGSKNLPERAAEYGLVFPAGPPSNAHNTLLVVATELGLPGLLVLAWVVVALARTLIGAIRVRGEPEHSLAIGLTAAFLAIAVDGISDYGYGDNAFFLTFVLLIAVAARLNRQARSSPSAAHAPLQQRNERRDGLPVPPRGMPTGVGAG